MTECHQCKTAIRGESGVMCDGVYKKVLQSSKKFSEIEYSIGIFDSGTYLRFMCDVDMTVEEIQNSVNKNKEKLVEYKREMETALKQNEERLKKINVAKKNCDKNVKEVKKTLWSDNGT